MKKRSYTSEFLDFNILYFAEIIKRFKKEIEKLKNKDIILFIGKASSGKSTLINYFCNIPLVLNDDSRFFFFNFMFYELIKNSFF